MDSTISPTNRFDVIDYNHLSPEPEWKRLGSGSFGRVVCGDYLGLPVAIKEIYARVDYNVEKYFARECKILQEARHPNIVQYIGLCLAPPGPPMDPHLYANSDDEEEHDSRSIVDHHGQKPAPRVLIVSEYLPKGSLRSHILAHSHANSPALSWRLRLSFAIDITRAIAYLHERRCLHRDLKLENCLITDNFRIKLCDFGFARLEPRNDDEIRRLSYCGTDGYMSPEILRGDPFGLATDIYSLGIILCELITLKLTGQTGPSSGFLERLPPTYAIKPADLKALLRANMSGCPEGLIQLGLKCCDVDSSRRPTIRTVLSTLDQIERKLIADEAQVLFNAVEAEARSEAGLAGPKGLAQRLVKVDHVGSFSFGSGKLPSLQGLSDPNQATHPSQPTPDPSRTGANPRRIPSFGGQVIVPSSKTHLSEPKSDQENESEDECSDDEDRVSVLEVARLLNNSQIVDPLHLSVAHTSTFLPQTTSETSIASTIKPHTFRPSSTSGASSPVEQKTIDRDLPTVSSSNISASDPPPYASESASVGDDEERLNSSAPTNGSRHLGTSLIPQSQTKTEGQLCLTAEGRCSIPLNIGTIKTVLSDSSPLKALHAVVPDTQEDTSQSGSQASLHIKPSLMANHPLIETNLTKNLSEISKPEAIPESPTAIDLEPEIPHPSQSQSSMVTKIELSTTYEETQDQISPPTELSKKSSEPSIEALLSIKKHDRPDIKAGPHRFTLFKPNWLTYLFANLQSSSGDSSEKIRKCSGCEKKIGMRKAFLACDDCGMKCHHKCSDRSELPICRLHSDEKRMVT